MSWGDKMVDLENPAERPWASIKSTINIDLHYRSKFVQGTNAYLK